MRPIREPNAKSRDKLRVSTVTTSFLLIERIPPTSIIVYPDSSRNHEEATDAGTRQRIIPMDTLLERSMRMEKH
jgi:hypothetical protein